MNTTAKSIYEDALRLSDSDRAELAAWLIESLDSDVDDDWEAAWSAEIRQRIDDIDSGKIATVPWPDARRLILGLSDGPSTD